jgi:hypothetical protein
LGAKYLVVLCAGSALLRVEDALTRIVNGALSEVSLGQQASPSRVWFFPGLTNLGFLLRENLLLCSSYLPLGVPNWTVILHQHRAASSIKEKTKLMLPYNKKTHDFFKGSLCNLSHLR